MQELHEPEHSGSTAEASGSEHRPSRSRWGDRLRPRWNVLAELAVIGLWSAWVGRAFLDFNAHTWPIGREFGSQIQAHHLWTQLQHCGLCALWNGGINGGVPALADVFGSTLHPLVAVATLLWGTVNGVKVAIVGSLWMAGIAQWWIARTLGVGRAARMWSCLLAVVGGHLAGRLEVGAFGLVLSTATASLALVAALQLGVTGQRRSTIWLALTGAMALVSGQGYLQLGLLAMAPAFLFLVLDENLRARPVWKEYLLAVALSILLIGVFLVPALHFWPNLSKFADADFKSSQPLEYILLNLVVRDSAFLRSEVLGKLPFPYLYTTFIGWVPAFLAVLSLRLGRREHRRQLLCLVSGVALTIFMASAAPLRWLVSLVPEFSGFRHAQLMAGLAIPAILGLAAYGLDRLLKLNWPQLFFRLRSNAPEPVKAFNTAWILLIPLFWSVQSAYEFSQSFFTTTNTRPVYESIQALRTPTLQWVAPPFGEHYWVEPALDAGLKVADVVWAWGWKDRAAPDARLSATRSDPPANAQVVGNLGDLPVYEDSAHEYALVNLGDQSVPCQASGSGGDLTVRCSTDRAGQLAVQENSWTGWYAWRDGTAVPLLPGQWLSVEAPAGIHEYRFRYLPWDVAAGAVVTLAGAILTVWLWFRARSAPAAGATASLPPGAP